MTPFSHQEVRHGKKYQIDVDLDEESGEMTVHRLTIKKPMCKDMGKYTAKCCGIETGSYMDVERE